MKHSLIANSGLAALLLGLCACSSVNNASEQERTSTAALVQEEAQDEGAEGEEAEPKDLEELERKAATAKTRLEVTRMEMQAFEQKHSSSLGHAEAELELATAKLKNFTDVEGPNSLAQQKLSFQGAQEGAAEAAEELAQLKIMYDGQDLNDMTREFVMARGKLRADRAQARLAIQASNLQAFEGHELPTKQRRIELEVEKATQSLEQAKLSGEISRINKQLSIEEAEVKLKKAEKELSEARDGDA